MFAPGTMPSPPTSPAARSETISPYKLGSNSTSNVSGRITNCMQAVSTINSVYSISPNSPPTVRNHFVFEARVQVFGILAEDRQVQRQVAVARLQAGQHAHRPEVHVQSQLLAQRHVDARVPAADGRGRRTLQAHARALQRGEHVVRK